MAETPHDDTELIQPSLDLLAALRPSPDMAVSDFLARIFPRRPGSRKIDIEISSWFTMHEPNEELGDVASLLLPAAEVCVRLDCLLASAVAQGSRSVLAQLSRLVILVYEDYGDEWLTPLTAVPAGHVMSMPTYLHLRAEHFLTSLEAACSNGAQPLPGPRVRPNQYILQRSPELKGCIGHIRLLSKELVVIADAVMKASRRKRPAAEMEDNDTGATSY